MASVRDVPCFRCKHSFGQHERDDQNIRYPRRCLVGEVVDVGIGKDFVRECECTSFVWEPYEEDPDRAWDDYKAGYTDIDGNVMEPLINEPEDY